MNNHLTEILPSGVFKLSPKSKRRIFFSTIKRWFKDRNPFEWRILLYRKHPNTLGDHRNMCKVGTNGKWLYLLTPQGEILPGQVSMTLRDRVNKIPEATIEVFVNLTEIVEVKD